MNARERILSAARALFAERGYARVSIRQIAAEADVSPALVMKLGGSKEQLFADATPPQQSPLSPDWPQDRVGVELARRIVARRDDAAAEPLLQALLGVLDSPDPAAARADFEVNYIERITMRAAPGEHRRERAELISAMLIGLGAALRPLRLLPADQEWVIERYGRMLQDLLDG